MRSIEYLQKLIAADPFSGFKLKPGSKRVVTFLRERPSRKIDLPPERGGARLLKLEGRELFTVYVPSPQGPVFMQLIEKTLGKEVTTRTWDTVRKAAGS